MELESQLSLYSTHLSYTLELKEQVILPFMSERIKIECEIPVAIKLIQGS